MCDSETNTLTLTHNAMSKRTHCTSLR